MANSKALKTGNSKATKPGKVVIYAITQAQFDSAFGAGVAWGSAYGTAADTLQPLLAPLSGQSSPEAIEQWNHLRLAFIGGAAQARLISPESANRAWVRIVDDLGLDKPQSERARAEAARRKANAPAKPTAPESEPEGTVMDGSGAQAAEQVQMALSKLEAHLIALLRAGKREMAATLIADGQFN